MPDSKRFLHPDAIKRISRLELRARHIVEGFSRACTAVRTSGSRSSSAAPRVRAGRRSAQRGLEGLGAAGPLYVKQYEEDTNLRCTMLVDVSNSMQYGNGPLNKYEYACTIAGSLAYLMLRQQDAVGCWAFDERVRSRVPGRTKRNHIHSVIESLSVSTPQDKTDMYAILRAAAESCRGAA
jgi:hypothetical protein